MCARLKSLDVSLQVSHWRGGGGRANRRRREEGKEKGRKIGMLNLSASEVSRVILVQGYLAPGTKYCLILGVLISPLVRQTDFSKETTKF